MDPTARASARSFNSVYRLTLRALAASTRQHPTSTKNLRTLYRPVFGDAAVRFRQYAANQSNETRSKLQQWNSRLDRTLMLLHSSATTGGPLKRLVRNISTLTDVYRTRVATDTSARQRQAGEWNGQVVTQVVRKKAGLPNEREKIQLSAWSALGELVVATENDMRCLLGRQEQRSLAFTRLPMLRRAVSRDKKGVYNLIGRMNTRPSRLKA